MVARLWQRMGEIYGAQWVNQFGQVGESAYETWCLALQDLSEADIRGGLSLLLKRESKYTPNLNEFRSLCTSQKSCPAHRIYQPALPEPEWRRQQKREVGRLAAQTATAVMHGRACFIEGRPDAETRQ